MTTEQQDIITYINKLRIEYADAGEDRRVDIIEEIEHLKKVNDLVNCRRDECKRLMFSDQLDPSYPFHSAECHKIWADANYGSSKETTTGRKSIAEMRKQLGEMAK